MKDIVIEHTFSNGCKFTATELDLSGGVTVENQWNVDSVKMATDFAEFGMWFATNVFPRLKSFQGYDCIKYTVIKNESIEK